MKLFAKMFGIFLCEIIALGSGSLLIVKCIDYFGGYKLLFFILYMVYMVGIVEIMWNYGNYVIYENRIKN